MDKNKRRDLTSGTFEGNKVPKKTGWIYSMSGIFRDACYVLVANNFMNYATTAGLLDKASYSSQFLAITIISIILLIWDGFNDPLMGMIIEKFHLKGGKFRPWILIGAIGNAVVVITMFLARPTGWWFVACYGIFYFLWDFVFTMNDIAYWSMLPSLSGDEKERAKLTTMVAVATGIGQAAMTLLIMLCTSGTNIAGVYGYLAIGAGLLFLLAQGAVYFFCKEKKRDYKQEEVSKKAKFGDLFKMIKINKPLCMSVLAIFFDYLMGAVAGSLLAYYFYFIYGFGGSYGGYVYVIYGAVGMVGSLLAQFLYGLISRKHKQSSIMNASFIGALCSLALLFFFMAPIFNGHPLAFTASNGTSLNIFSGTGLLVVLPSFFWSAFTSIFYLVLLVYMQNAIDYNEWKYGERKESMAFAWRPLDAKISSAVMSGIKYVILLSTGTVAVFNTISDVNQQTSVDKTLSSEEIAALNQKIMDAIAALSTTQIMGFVIWTLGLMLICLVVSYLFIKLGYGISDEQYKQIVNDLEERHKEDEKQLNEPNTPLQTKENGGSL